MSAVAAALPAPVRLRGAIGSRPHADLGTPLDDDARLLAGLREGDEEAFRQLVRRHHGALKGFARTFGASDALAEEIVQETWVVVLESLDRFEGRSSLKHWLFGILKNKARHRTARERRTIPFSAFARAEDAADPVIDPSRFQTKDGCWPGHWAVPPRPWQDPQRRLASLEARDRLREAISTLPERQRIVVALRDVEGLDPEEVCELLEISEGNQRVILHRARAAIRERLEEYFDE